MDPKDPRRIKTINRQTKHENAKQKVVERIVEEENDDDDIMREI